MKKIRTLIIILSIIVILVVILICVTIKFRDNKNTGEHIGDEGMPIDEYVGQFNPRIEKVNVKSEFYIVKNAIERYYTSLSEINSPEIDIGTYGSVEGFDEEQYIQEVTKDSRNIIYSFLDDNYIKEFNVTKENLLEKLGKYEKVSIVIDKMYVSQNSTYISTYFVYGITENKEKNEISNFTVMITIDSQNRRFNISPYEYIMKLGYDKLKEGEELKRNIQIIDNKQYNSYDYKTISDDTVIKDYIDLYRIKALYRTKESYNLLDKEYREKRFGSLNNYEKYVNENLNSIRNISIYEFSTQGGEKDKRYICTDMYNNYYILKETDIMQYSLILDTYTIDLPEFLEKYNSTNVQGKVALNIQKFTDSINNKDYKYAYSKLAPGFKSKYFSTLQSFENYMKKHIYEDNKISYSEFKEEGNAYTYKVYFRNNKNSNAKAIEKTFIMQLQNGTEFILSFNVD